jgi:hypothetical protein
MALVRMRVACRGRTELHEISGPDVEIGRDPSCRLSIDHPSVAPHHARVLVRRNRMILTDLGQARTGTSRDGERVLAPIALNDGDTFLLGDVSFRARLVSEDDRGFAGCTIARGKIARELESFDPQTRRYELEVEGRRAELAVVEPSVSRDRAGRWMERMNRSAALVPHLAPLLACETIEDRASIIEAAPGGIRASTLIEAIEAGIVGVPVEAMIVVLAHLADAVAAIGSAIGAHGAVDPAFVQLGLDGSISLLRPGPHLDERSLKDELVAPERRFFFEATPAGDAFALGKIGATLLRLSGESPARLRAICAWLAHADAERRPKDLRTLSTELRSAAMRDGLDPTYGHVARAVRAIAPGRTKALAVVAAW